MNLYVLLFHRESGRSRKSTGLAEDFFHRMWTWYLLILMPREELVDETMPLKHPVDRVGRVLKRCFFL